jgi:hypothetical protein
MMAECRPVEAPEFALPFADNHAAGRATEAEEAFGRLGFFLRERRSAPNDTRHAGNPTRIGSLAFQREYATIGSG